MTTPQPLAGIKVLDLSRVVSGPLCGRMLADLGADVVKIEAPVGDNTRTVPPFIDGVSVYYAQLNAGKRNVSIDLKAPGAPALLARLAGSVDVLLENFRPGVMARHGLDADTLLAANPRLVYCSVTGWGQDGPWMNRRAYAPLVHADAGGVDFAARVRGRRPEQEVNQHGDVYTAMLASNAILAGLLQRVATGRGQHLDVAMGQAALYVNEWAAVALQEPLDEFGGFDTWTHRMYQLGDGSYVALVGNPVNQFPDYVRALGGDESLLADPRFATTEARRAHVPEMVDALDQITTTYQTYEDLEPELDEWMFSAHVRSIDDLARTEWAEHRGLTVEVAPGVRVPRAPWSSSDSSVGATPSVAERGADNHAVLEGFGITDDEIAALEQLGVLRSA